MAYNLYALRPNREHQHQSCQARQKSESCKQICESETVEGEVNNHRFADWQVGLQSGRIQETS